MGCCEGLNRLNWRKMRRGLTCLKDQTQMRVVDGIYGGRWQNWFCKVCMNFRRFKVVYMIAFAWPSLVNVASWLADVIISQGWLSKVGHPWSVIHSTLGPPV